MTRSEMTRSEMTRSEMTRSKVKRSKMMRSEVKKSEMTRSETTFIHTRNEMAVYRRRKKHKLRVRHLKRLFFFQVTLLFVS